MLVEVKLYEGETCYFTFIALKNELQPLYERVTNIEGMDCVFQQDKYRPEYWLERCPGNATKRSAIQRIKQLRGCQRGIQSFASDSLLFSLAAFLTVQEHFSYPADDYPLRKFSPYLVSFMSNKKINAVALESNFN
ncbi:MAG: hypothetical protein HFH73_09045 [Lachnospiraceae bacterium]|jgi:hypothetical protein|nr:hypothetical protein [Lachnospiraceae bacterium]